jgi:hypothetical protein
MRNLEAELPITRWQRIAANVTIAEGLLGARRPAQ